MFEHLFHLCWIIFIVCLTSSSSKDLTFELLDREKQCFYEYFHANDSFTIEYQVVRGGNYDVDVVIRTPLGKDIYKKQKNDYDYFEGPADENGVYEVCFSNEFSTFTHKVVFMDWRSTNEDSDFEFADGDEAMARPQKALTQIENNVDVIHGHLERITIEQNRNRLREAKDRSRVENLRDRVQFWSLGQLFLIIVVSVGSVFILRSFFHEKQTRKEYARP